MLPGGLFRAETLWIWKDKKCNGCCFCGLNRLDSSSSTVTSTFLVKLSIPYVNIRVNFLVSSQDEASPDPGAGGRGQRQTGVLRRRQPGAGLPVVAHRRGGGRRGGKDRRRRGRGGKSNFKDKFNYLVHT